MALNEPLCDKSINDTSNVGGVAVQLTGDVAHHGGFLTMDNIECSNLHISQAFFLA
jgi:hypothetical protein